MCCTQQSLGFSFYMIRRHRQWLSRPSLIKYSKREEFEVGTNYCIFSCAFFEILDCHKARHMIRIRT